MLSPTDKAGYIAEDSPCGYNHALVFTVSTFSVNSKIVT